MLKGEVNFLRLHGKGHLSPGVLRRGPKGWVEQASMFRGEYDCRKGEKRNEHGEFSEQGQVCAKQGLVLKRAQWLERHAGSSKRGRMCLLEVQVQISCPWLCILTQPLRNQLLK